MKTEPVLFKGSLLAQRAFVGATVLFGMAVMIQVFLAGEAALVAPDQWALHVSWIHIFQWLSVALPPLAYVASRRLGFSLFNCLPMVIIGLQYILIHRAVNQLKPVLAGVHAVNGLLLFAFAIHNVQVWWRNAAASPG